MSFILALCTIVASAQVKILGKIEPNGSTDTYPTHTDSLGRGGLMAVGTWQERNSIPRPRRKAGMLVRVKSATVDSTYTIGGNLTNADWTVFAAGGGAPKVGSGIKVVNDTLKLGGVVTEDLIIGNPETDLNGLGSITMKHGLFAGSYDVLQSFSFNGLATGYGALNSGKVSVDPFTGRGSFGIDYGSSQGNMIEMYKEEYDNNGTLSPAVRMSITANDSKNGARYLRLGDGQRMNQFGTYAASERFAGNHGLAEVRTDVTNDATTGAARVTLIASEESGGDENLRNKVDVIYKGYGIATDMGGEVNIQAAGLVATGGERKLQKININPQSSGMVITDDWTSKGLTYAGNYGANFTDRSLVDKKYVDSVAASSGGSDPTKANVDGSNATGTWSINTTGNATKWGDLTAGDLFDNQTSGALTGLIGRGGSGTALSWSSEVIKTWLSLPNNTVTSLAGKASLAGGNTFDGSQRINTGGVIVGGDEFGRVTLIDNSNDKDVSLGFDYGVVTGGYGLGFRGAGAGLAVLLNNLSENREYEFPNASGTFALTSDIPKMFTYSTVVPEGGATTYTVPHGLGYTPTMVIVTANTVDAASGFTTTQTNIKPWAYISGANVIISYADTLGQSTGPGEEGNTLSWTIMVK